MAELERIVEIPAMGMNKGLHAFNIYNIIMSNQSRHKIFLLYYYCCCCFLKK